MYLIKNNLYFTKHLKLVFTNVILIMFDQNLLDFCKEPKKLIIMNTVLSTSIEESDSLIALQKY